MLAVAGETLLLDLDKIRDLRQRRGLTMEEAAEAAGMGGEESRSRRQAWYMIESGRRKDVTLAMVTRLASALSCKPSALLKEER